MNELSTAAVPIIKGIFDHRDHHDTSESLVELQVQHMTARGPIARHMVKLPDLRRAYGKPWVKQMLTSYAVLFTDDAADRDRSLHQYARDQLLLVKEIAVKFRFKAIEVFGPAMTIRDGQEEPQHLHVAQKIKELLGFTDMAIKLPNKPPKGYNKNAFVSLPSAVVV